MFELVGAAASVPDDPEEVGVPAAAVVEVAGWGVVLGVAVFVSVVVVETTARGVLGAAGVYLTQTKMKTFRSVDVQWPFHVSSLQRNSSLESTGIGTYTKLCRNMKLSVLPSAFTIVALWVPADITPEVIVTVEHAEKSDTGRVGS